MRSPASKKQGAVQRSRPEAFSGLSAVLVKDKSSNGELRLVVERLRTRRTPMEFFRGILSTQGVPLS